MRLNLSDLKLTPGRLLILPQQADRDDVLQLNEVREISHGVVVKSNVDEKEIGPGTQIVYDRVHSDGIELQDENGEVNSYRFLLWRDVAAWAN